MGRVFEVDDISIFQMLGLQRQRPMALDHDWFRITAVLQLRAQVQNRQGIDGDRVELRVLHQPAPRPDPRWRIAFHDVRDIQ
jgi:hypothetical protein